MNKMLYKLLYIIVVVVVVIIIMIIIENPTISAPFHHRNHKKSLDESDVPAYFKKQTLCH